MEKNKKYGLQYVLSVLGQNGCYILCLAYIARKCGASFNDIFEGLKISLDQEVIYINPRDKEDPNNCYVNNAEKVLFNMTKKIFSVKKVIEINGKLNPEKFFVIECYSLKTTNGTKTHFCMKDFDPYPNSNTKTRGQLHSLRLVEKIR